MPTGTKLNFDNPELSDAKLEDVPDETTHYVHLADGRVLSVKHDGVFGDVHTDSNGKRTLVIGVYPKDV